MRVYNQQHRFYCGVDLHARNGYPAIRRCSLSRGRSRHRFGLRCLGFVAFLYVTFLAIVLPANAGRPDDGAGNGGAYA